MIDSPCGKGNTTVIPETLTPKFRSFDLNDVDHQWLASHLRF